MIVTNIAQSIARWIRRDKAIFMALLLLLLCFGVKDTIITLIDKSLVRFTNLTGNRWLDWFFIIVTLFFCGRLCLTLLKHKKVIAPRTVALIIVPLVLYVYFRFVSNSPYSFTSFWNGPICYLDGFAFIGALTIVAYVFQQVKNDKTQVIDDNYRFDVDAPIRRLDKDLFQMDSLVKRIVNYISFTDVNEAAFSMGLVGEWGDGKTSLMNLVEERIKQENKDFIIVHFNPRASKKADFVQEDFLDSLKHALVPYHSGIERTIDKYAVALDLIPGMPSIVSKALELFRPGYDKEREITRRNLSKAIKAINRRLVVFIDDLDRLTGEELLEVLKVLDTNGAFPNMVFLTSFDKDYVNTVLNNYLNLGHQQRNYTDKYFTVEIRVPLHPSFRLLTYLIDLLKNACVRGFIHLDATTVEEAIKKQSIYLLRRLHTIRDIKRFSNQFLYDYVAIQREVNFRDFLLLELIKFSHTDDYKAIYRFDYIHKGQPSLYSNSGEDLYLLNDRLLPQKDKNGNALASPELVPDSIDILKALFPDGEHIRSWYPNRFQRIYCVSSFEHFFYNYEYGHLIADDFDRLFQTHSLSEACKMVDNWSAFSKDLETFLLTRDISSYYDRSELRRLFQLLLYSSSRFPSINYPGQSYAFIRKEDATMIIRNCTFSSHQEYVSWLKDSLYELSTVNPILPSSYLQVPIDSFYSDNADPELFIMSQQEILDYANEIQNDYLARIGTNGWDVNVAFYMTSIQRDVDGTILSSPSKALRDAIRTDFKLFSSSLPAFYEEHKRSYAGYNVQLRFNSLFKDPDEFENLIYSEDNLDAPEIELIKAIWPLYKANNYTSFQLPKGQTIAEAKRTLLDSSTKELNRLEEIKERIDRLANDWNDGHRLSNVDQYTNRANELLDDLNSVAIELKIQEKYRYEIQDLLSSFSHYSKHARDINAETLRKGDFIRLKNIVYDRILRENPEKIIYRENLFAFCCFSDSGELMTDETSIPLSFDDVEAVLIDGAEDAAVYYQPHGIMATYVEPGGQIPAYTTDYSYYLDRFKRCYDVEGKSYFDLVNGHGFQFLHEVQHWLKDEVVDEGLEIHHTLREGLSLTSEAGE